MEICKALVFCLEWIHVFSLMKLALLFEIARITNLGYFEKDKELKGLFLDLLESIDEYLRKVKSMSRYLNLLAEFI